MHTSRRATCRHPPALFAGLAALLLTGATAGCADANRTVYETLQNIQAQQCERDYSGKCPGRRSYDEYRRETGQ